MMTHFQVKHYKCLGDVSLPLTPLHVIIGQNDSGKTSLLEAMLALHQSDERPISHIFTGRWMGEELIYDKATSSDVILSAAYSEGGDEREQFSRKLVLEFAEDGPKCQKTEELFRTKNLNIHLSSLHSEMTGLALLKLDNGAFWKANPDLTSDERAFLLRAPRDIGSAQLYQLDPKTMSIPAAIDPGRKFRLDRDGFGLAALLDDILSYEPELFLAIRHAFCGYFPQFRSVKLATVKSMDRRSTPNGLFKTSLTNGKGILFETIHGKTIRAQQASDGAILFLGLLALMHTPEPPKLLLIEEPEKGVYPKRLAEVIGLLRELEADSAKRPVPQIVLTTHSPYLLSAFRPEEVTLLRREGDTGPVKAYPLRDAPHIEERLGEDEFYLGELWYNLTEDELLGNAQS